MKKCIFALLLMTTPFFLFAQDAERKAEWRTLVSAGFIAGQSGTDALVQLTGTVVRGRYSAGLGVGYDAYEFEAIPVFADFRYAFDRRKLAFAYVDAGYNIPRKEEVNESFVTERHMRGGFWGDAGLGYRIPLNRRNHLALSGGYSRKHLSYEKVVQYPCVWGPCDSNTYLNKYSFGRVLVKLSWELSY